MNVVNIKEPIWKNRTVGIAESKIGKSGVVVNILYKDKMGNKVFPNKYHCSVEMAKKAPRMLRRGNALRLIRIADLEVLS